MLTAFSNIMGISSIRKQNRHSVGLCFCVIEGSYVACFHGV